MNLTIAYITARKDPKINWFLHSLEKQISQLGLGFRLDSIVVVSPHLEQLLSSDIYIGDLPLQLVYPKPSVWQGPNRLTKEDWFSAANARNTALCKAVDGYIAYVDDLSVLTPGWLSAVREAVAGGYVVCGAYKKVKHLNVENGIIKSYEEYPGGIDGRWQYAKSDPCPAEAGWLFGCSCAMPVEALLTINGWNEVADGIGMEDCTTGAVLVNAGFQMKYDRRMLTIESEEHHHIEPSPRREDWHFEDGKPVTGGNGTELDCSHSLLNIAKGSKRFEYDIGCGFKDIRELRQHILKGKDFPVRKHPEHHWYTRQLLSEL